ncbi:hypothetical protein AYI70_g4138 [Smittium culicis]|uniref:K Homology domain-containing protein n=1 Tax=Smittium culicis TaxID=133412 RepID=A0A1R1Y0L2_9FUNG|nr:hypothetical protein AYI70_g4138 [Smittium culicis]
MSDDIKISGSAAKQRFSLSDYKNNRTAKFSSPEITKPSNNSFIVQAKSELENLQFLFNLTGTKNENSKNIDTNTPQGDNENRTNNKINISKSGNSYNLDNHFELDFDQSQIIDETNLKDQNWDSNINDTWNQGLDSPKKKSKASSRDSRTISSSTRHSSVTSKNSKHNHNNRNSHSQRNGNNYDNHFSDNDSTYNNIKRSSNILDDNSNSVLKNNEEADRSNKGRNRRRESSVDRNKKQNRISNTPLSRQKKPNTITSENGVIITDTTIRTPRTKFSKPYSRNTPRSSRNDSSLSRNSNHTKPENQKEYSNERSINEIIDHKNGTNSYEDTQASRSNSSLSYSSIRDSSTKRNSNISIVSIFSYIDSGVIIGSRGYHLDSLREIVPEVNWHITSTRYSGQDRLLTIRGRSEEISRAYYYLANHFISEKVFTEISISQLTSEDKNSIDTSSPLIALRFIVHNKTCGAVIGHNSDNLHQIKIKSRVAKLRVYPGFLSGTRERVIEVIGTPKSIREAVFQIGLAVEKGNYDLSIGYSPVKDGIGNFLFDQGAPESSINFVSGKNNDNYRNSRHSNRDNSNGTKSDDDFDDRRISNFRTSGENSLSKSTDNSPGNDNRKERQSDRRYSEFSSNSSKKYHNDDKCSNKSESYSNDNTDKPSRNSRTNRNDQESRSEKKSSNEKIPKIEISSRDEKKSSVKKSSKSDRRSKDETSPRDSKTSRDEDSTRESRSSRGTRDARDVRNERGSRSRSPIRS